MRSIVISGANPVTGRRFRCFMITTERPPIGLVVAVDPGETTGLAVMDVGRSRPREVVGFYSGEIPAQYGSGVLREVAEVRTALNIVGRLEAIQDDDADRSISSIVVEDFTLRLFNSDKSLLSPVRLTMALLSFIEASETLVCSVEFQSPSDAKTIVTNAMLRSHGMWHVGQVHSNDAARHLLLWLRKHRGWQ